jgi:hypothetical protein
LGDLCQRLSPTLSSKLAAIFNTKDDDYPQRSPKQNQVAYSER